MSDSISTPAELLDFIIPIAEEPSFSLRDAVRQREDGLDLKSSPRSVMSGKSLGLSVPQLDLFKK